ncbi:hypothetical protein O0I10_002807 [Lichtheimia ornata]|uniref:C3H1-type domain-containing protein n=1 Tax=Lichtheimia ornata TaxID=688661 RepID=A0AAD7V9S7_9FUNG|nr:uncharacterized protein O0I10_002807 [Lichtheimia ornata]KAJ8661540.1 hypothetical protein O0I10_002807 [Lichtheimia ornata]
MYSTAHSTKRFPTACRFFAQGNCRAGDECLFAHILPIHGVPSANAHAVIIGDNALDDTTIPIASSPTHQSISQNNNSDSHSIQRAIRDLELDQLEKKYKPYKDPSSGPEDSFSMISVSLPLQDTRIDPTILHLDLVIPVDYPDSQCAIRIQNHDLSPQIKQRIEDAFEAHEWHQQRHITLVQQLDWLSVQFPDLIA